MISRYFSITFFFRATKDDVVCSSELKDLYDLEYNINDEKTNPNKFAELMKSLSYEATGVKRNGKVLRRYRNLKYKLEDFIKNNLRKKADILISSFVLFEKYKSVYNVEEIQQRSFDFLMNKFNIKYENGNYFGYEIIN